MNSTQKILASILEHNTTYETESMWRDIGIPISVQRDVDAQVVWINHRWFAEKGLNLSDEEQRVHVSQWLLDNFAFVILSLNATSTDYQSEEQTFYADRYGGKGMGNAGGSGRCAYTKGFYVKGVGATPLRDQNGPYFHTHGAVTLEEAIREAIYSEIAAGDLPFGVVPSIAIISIGRRIFHGVKDQDGEPCALLIRPAFIRAGHFERAMSFSPKVELQAHIEADEQRVHRMNALLRHPQLINGCNIRPDALLEFARRIAAQMACAKAYRMAHGSYISSNLAINGELADFGSFRILPTWESAYFVKGMPTFGSEWAAFCRTVLYSLSFHASNFGKKESDSVDNVQTSAMQIIQEAEDEFQRTLKKECIGLFGITAESEIINNFWQSLQKYIDNQNQTRRDYFVEDVRNLPGPLLLRQLQTNEVTEDESNVATIKAALVNAIATDMLPDAQRHIAATMKRTLDPRMGLSREGLQQWIYYELIYGKPLPWLKYELQRFIDIKISQGRRRWSNINSNFTILGQTICGASYALWLRERISGNNLLLMSSPMIDQKIVLFGTTISVKNGETPNNSAHYPTITIQIGSNYCGQEIGVKIENILVRVPPMSVIYE